MNYKSQIGLHLRLSDDNISSVAQQAQRLNLSCFQFFVTAPPNHDKYLKITAKERAKFLQLSEQFTHLYIHSSYWINPSTGKKDSSTISRQLLKKEIEIAKQLNVQALVLHGGSAKGHLKTEDDPLCKKQGIQSLAKILNTVLKNETEVKILLENTAHGNQTIGSDLQDFVLLKEYLEFPEKIGFCLDLAHAHSFGYNLSNGDSFAQTLDKAIGLSNIHLLHLNDTNEKLGSKKDRHAIPGQGEIGKDNLIKLLNSPYFINIPKISELPLMTMEEMQIFLADVNTWLIINN